MNLCNSKLTYFARNQKGGHKHSKEDKDHSNCKIYDQMTATRPLLPFAQTMNMQTWTQIRKITVIHIKPCHARTAL